MNMLLAKVFVIAFLLTYAVLIVGLIAWILRQKVRASHHSRGAGDARPPRRDSAEPPERSRSAA